jgi:hypothetical protein
MHCQARRNRKESDEKNLRRKRKGEYLLVEVQAKALKETEVVFAAKIRTLLRTR